MKATNFHKLILVLIASFLLGDNVLYAQQQQLPLFEIELVRDNVYVGVFKRPDNGARIGSKITIQKGKDGILLVDGSFSQIYRLTKIKLAEFSDLPIKYLINSHFHPDHSGGNGEFLNDGVTIIAQENTREILSKEQKGYGLSTVGSVDVFPAITEDMLPNSTFSDSQTLYFNDERIVITHYEAHTSGDAVVYFEKANVFDVGDIIWPHSFAFVDWNNGGSAQGILSSVEQMLSQSNEETKFISGHESTISYNEVKEYRDMLKATIDEVISMKKAGLPLEKAQEKGLHDRWEKWASILVPESIWIEMIYKSK